MKKNPLSFFKTISIGLKDGILILVVLATISPFVYRQVLGRTTSSSNVAIGSVDVPDAQFFRHETQRARASGPARPLRRRYGG